MPEYLVKRKNTSIQVVSIKDSEGSLVEDLSTAQEIKFVVKAKRDGDKLIEKTKDDGIEVLSGDDLGKLKITLTPADTDLEQGSYLMALQIKYSDTKIYEVNLKSEGVGTESFRVVTDLIS